MAIFGALRAITTAMTGNKAKSDDRALRPKTFAEYGGQEELVASLRISVAAARGRAQALDHTLITGPAGLGKTTLAEVVANELGVKIVVLMGPMLKEKEDLVRELVRVGRNSVLFIDEIHAMSPKVSEVLYTAMEDYMVTVMGDGRSHQVRLEPFTLIGATTNMGKLLKPLKDRFGIKAALRPYRAEKLAEIVQAAAVKMGTQCLPEAAMEIARRSQSTPRIALSILRRVADCAFVARAAVINHAVAVRGCEVAGYDKSGLNELARLYLRTLAERGVPVALGTMVSMLSETKDVIEDEVEPYLLSIGFIEKTPKGRSITAEGRRHLMGTV